MDRKKIAKNYIKTNFSIDLFAITSVLIHPAISRVYEFFIV